METSDPLLITLVERQKRNSERYNISLNGSFAFSVHEDLLIKYKLLKGEYIENELLQTVLLEDERHRAYLEAIRFIGRRPRSTREVKLKLKQKGHDPAMIEQIIERLIEQKYIDDEQFAKMWAEHRILLHKKGKNWVQQELAQKGVHKIHIDGAISEIGEDAEFAAAYELAVKKWNITGGDRTAQTRKTAAFLLRRGFSAQLVNRILKELDAEPLDDLGD